jgi:hypothetical protein
MLEITAVIVSLGWIVFGIRWLGATGLRLVVRPAV